MSDGTVEGGMVGKGLGGIVGDSVGSTREGDGAGVTLPGLGAAETGGGSGASVTAGVGGSEGAN